MNVSLLWILSTRLRDLQENRFESQTSGSYRSRKNLKFQLFELNFRNGLAARG